MEEQNDAEEKENAGAEVLPGKDIADAVDKEILESVCNDAEEEDRLKTPDLAASPPDSDQNDNVQEEVVAAHEAPVSKHPVELPITHLKNPENKNKVFAATPDLLKRRDLVPCDENGKQVYDHRRLN